uniref:HSF-type DNA-binding domain-containing protein n=1 Tax=Prolemur simus TaxID=1328070 RepID=A0A8C8ZW44_PROSS
MEAACSVAVPGFLAKLWALVDDTVLDDVIGWNENGQTFRVVNEQIFSKDLLPKYFKHSNISSFIRQLNMYGFRKVITSDSRMTGQEKKVAMEFQHPFFKKGEAGLLENIKRKVPTMKTEDVRTYTDEFQRMMAEVQEMREKQSNMDAKFAEMKKEYSTLCIEMTNLRQKYCEQQQLLTQVPVQSFEGFLSFLFCKLLIRMEILKNGYALLEDKNKILLDHVLSTLKDESKNLVSSVDQTNGDDGKEPEMSIQDVPMSEDSLDIDLDLVIPDFQGLMTMESFGQETKNGSLELVSSSQVNDPILTEDKSDTQCNTILNRDEMHMHCIEANLVELKSLLSRKKMNYNSDNVSEVSLSIHKQVVQYMKNPLLSLSDEMPINDLGERLQDSNDFLLDDLKNPSNVLPHLGDHDYIALNGSSPLEGAANPIEIFEPKLSTETNGEYKLFPMFFLNPVANFIEECTKIEPSS